MDLEGALFGAVSSSDVFLAAIKYVSRCDNELTEMLIQFDRKCKLKVTRPIQIVYIEYGRKGLRLFIERANRCVAN